MTADPITSARGCVGRCPAADAAPARPRDTGWDEVADQVRLDTLDSDSAAAVLVTRSGQHDKASHDAAELIAAELGFLPLALNQASAYVTASRISLAVYLTLLRDRPAAMYAATSGQAQQTIARTWDISLEAIRGHDPAAVSLLYVLACYAPDQVPRVILGGKTDADPVVINKALALLASDGAESSW